MGNYRWEIRLGTALVVVSALVYFVHYALFHDAHHIFIYLVGDIAFVPIEVLLVTVLIHRLLEQREKSQKLEKLNIVIGAFFSEVGTRMLAHLSDSDPNLEDIKSFLVVEQDWGAKDFTTACSKLELYDYEIDISKVNLTCMRDMLVAKREFLVRLLENPILLEHESFTTLLQAVFHATEELEARDDLSTLPESDIQHLQGDLLRAYTQLVGQWIGYMQHLNANYPYLFSLAMRLNPFDRSSSAVVK